MVKKTALLSLVLLYALGLVSCGGDDDTGTVASDDAPATTMADDEGTHDMPEAEDGNPCAADAPDDALPPGDELDPDGAEITVTAKDYEFLGIDPLTEGGAFAITFDNEGTEMHELAIARLADDEERPLDEIIASGEEPETTEIGFGIACPGDSTTVNANISEPGRYVAVCLIPVGTTPEAMEAPDGAPHASQGKASEVEIS